MGRKQKRKLTAAERRAKRERKKKYMVIFVNGKQKQVLREPTIDGLPEDEFIARNADPIWLHQMGMWELMPLEYSECEESDPEEFDSFDSDDEIEPNDLFDAFRQ